MCEDFIGLNFQPGDIVIGVGEYDDEQVDNYTGVITTTSPIRVDSQYYEYLVVFDEQLPHYKQNSWWVSERHLKHHGQKNEIFDSNIDFDEFEKLISST